MTVRIDRRNDCALLMLLMLFASAPQAVASNLKVVNRTTTQDQGNWIVVYTVQYTGPNTILVIPDEVAGKVEGWVSNSSVLDHAHPRWVSTKIQKSQTENDICGSGDVIASADDERKCVEYAFLQLWTGMSAPKPPHPQPNQMGFASPKTILGQEIIILQPESFLNLRLYLQHRHWIYGDYHTLLGERQITLHLGSSAEFSDSITLNREQYSALPCSTIGDSQLPPPEERLDTRVFMSKPHSLHIEAHIAGNKTYHFPEKPVRYKTKMRLRFWYMVAPGSEDECRARIIQYTDFPRGTRVSISSGSYEEVLKVVGRWTRVERVFWAEDEATTIALDFRVCGAADVGEFWVDDVSVEPVVVAIAAGP